MILGPITNHQNAASRCRDINAQTNRGTRHQPKRAEKDYTMFKTATLAFAAIAASASIASADTNNISNFVMEQNRGGQVELGTVTASGDGVVEIFDFHKGVVGALIGSTAVKAGANLDVDVNIPRPETDAVAFLKVNGQVVDTQEIDFN